jgi:hypothetical protein
MFSMLQNTKKIKKAERKRERRRERRREIGRVRGEREGETDCQESYIELSNITYFIASAIRMTMGIFSAIKTVPC